ncbi:unnamed protein product [Boreogadus saida]
MKTACLLTSLCMWPSVATEGHRASATTEGHRASATRGPPSLGDPRATEPRPPSLDHRASATEGDRGPPSPRATFAEARLPRLGRRPPSVALGRRGSVASVFTGVNFTPVKGPPSLGDHRGPPSLGDPRATEPRRPEGDRGPPSPRATFAEARLPRLGRRPPSVALGRRGSVASVFTGVNFCVHAMAC